MAIDVDAFMRHVRIRGFGIDDREFVGKPGDRIRRFVISKPDRIVFFDIDELLWNDLSQDGLLRQGDICMDGMNERKEPK